MQLLSPFPGSGKLGGVVGSRGRAGYQLRARVASCNPRSSRQQQARALTGALAGIWRALTPQQTTAWATLAQGSETGYSLFLACNRRLATIGRPALDAAPPNRPTLPAISAFAVAPIYDNAVRPVNIVAFTLSYDIGPNATLAAIVRATASLSPAKGNFRPSDLKTIATLNPAPPGLAIVSSAWNAVYGQAPTTGNITFALSLLDPASGFAGPAVLASTTYQVYLPYPSPPTTVVIYVDDVEVAVVPNTAVQVDGVQVAGLP
jgi:hypothetical protein